MTILNTIAMHIIQVCCFRIASIQTCIEASFSTVEPPKKGHFGDNINSGVVSFVGLDKLCFFFCLLFFLTILKKSAYYSNLGYPLFQFKDVTFILKRQFICGCIVALQKVKYNPLVLSLAFEKKSFSNGKVHACLVASAYSTYLL